MSLKIVLLLVLICASTIFASICNPSNAREGILKSSLKDYVLFAGSGYTFAGDVHTTFLTGNIASFPTASPLASNPMVTLSGSEISDQTSTNIAANDLIDMYNIGFDKTGRKPISGDIGSLTITPGVYFSESTIGMTGDVTLDAQGNTGAVFVFISGSALFGSPGSRIILTNGASPCSVYWFVGSSATLNTNSYFVGTVNAYASITIGANSTVVGRLLARQAITVDKSSVGLPTCSVPPADTLSCSSILNSTPGASQNSATNTSFQLGLILSVLVAVALM
jgi:hypothetical protein